MNVANANRRTIVTYDGDPVDQRRAVVIDSSTTRTLAARGGTRPIIGEPALGNKFTGEGGPRHAFGRTTPTDVLRVPTDPTALPSTSVPPGTQSAILNQLARHSSRPRVR